MSDDDLERTLRDAFDAAARSSVPDSVGPPPPRFADGRATARARRRLLAPLAAAAAVLAIGGSVAALEHGSSGSGDHRTTVAGHSPSTYPTTRTAAPSAGSRTPTHPNAPLASATAPQRAVHIRLLNADGASYGVGMPVIAFFSRRITDARPLQAATSITINGQASHGAWYFEPSSYMKGYPVEGHLRLPNFWPAHAKVRVALKAKGLAAGAGMVFDDSLSETFATGPADIAVVDDVKHLMTVTRDGKPIGTFPVSLGASKTPTASGVKVIMEKGRAIAMRGPGYYDPHVRFTQRLTYGGEYLHSAPWNIGNIQRGLDTSNGCTNLMPQDATWLYKTLEVGDVVEYPNARGPRMKVGDGYGDWNMSWSQWTSGGLVPTR